jgi:hypothetical protein
MDLSESTNISWVDIQEKELSESSSSISDTESNIENVKPVHKNICVCKNCGEEGIKYMGHFSCRRKDLCNSCLGKQNYQKTKAKIEAGKINKRYQKKIKPPSMFKKCNGCGELLEIGKFSKCKSHKTGFQTICKPCYKIKYRKPKKQDVDDVIETQETELKEIDEDKRLLLTLSDIVTKGRLLGYS